MKFSVSLVFSLKQTIILQEKCVCVYVRNILKTTAILLGSMLLNSDFEHMPSLTAIQVCL